MFVAVRSQNGVAAVKKNYRAPHIADEASHERGAAMQIMDAETINEKPEAALLAGYDWARAGDDFGAVATFLIHLAIDVAKLALFMCCTLPAVLINYEAMAGQSNAALVASVMSAVLAACGVVLIMSDRFGAGKKLFATVLTLVLISYNVRNAIGMSAARHQITQDNAINTLVDSTNINERITDKKTGLAEQIKTAGHDSVATYESQIRNLQLLGYKTARWEGIGSTEHCTQVHITTSDERELCHRINDYKIKKTAAQTRDRLEGELVELENTRPKPARTRLDAEVANIGVFIGLFGYKLDDNGKKILESGIDWQFGLIVEAIGSGGPELVLLLFMLFDPRETEKARRKKAEREAVRAARRTEREARRDEKRKEAARRRAEKAQKVKPIQADPEPRLPELKPEETDGSDPQSTAFLNRNTTSVTGGRVPPKKLYEVWKSDCAERGIKPGTQRAFSDRIAKFVNRETKNNRNTWVGIAIKDRAAAPDLRVVGGDGDSAATKGAKRRIFAV